MMVNKQETIGLKFDSEKVDWSLVPLRSIEEIAKVLAMGKKKYGAWNWIHVDDAINRYTSALLRHLTAIQEGESLDSESGLSHYSHLACNALFLVYLDLHKSKGLAKTPTINIENRIDPHKTFYNEDGSINEDTILESLCETKVYTREGA